jgi:hypothetical protein
MRNWWEGDLSHDSLSLAFRLRGTSQEDDDTLRHDQRLLGKAGTNNRSEARSNGVQKEL